MAVIQVILRISLRNFFTQRSKHHIPHPLESYRIGIAQIFCGHLRTIAINNEVESDKQISDCHKNDSFNTEREEVFTEK
ncbi:unnamed protein product [Rhizophagus irregularis]|nr:unnamed protein product [Rhizophagus irregularis]